MSTSPGTDFARLTRLPPYVFNITTELKMAARRRGETAIGLRSNSQGHLPPGYGVTLNPRKDAPLTLTADDCVVLVAAR